MSNLTPAFEPETGQVILEGAPAGPAGEAPLIPVPGLELAFDHADGRLVRAVVDTARPGALGEQVAAMLTRLFGSAAPDAVSGAARLKGENQPLSPEPDLTALLSDLARLDADRATSPVSPSSPWWAAEAADLAERAGLRARALLEASHALPKLAWALEHLAALPAVAVHAATAVAELSTGDGDRKAVARLRDALATARPSGRSSGLPPFDVAAEVERIEKHRTQVGGLQWLLDPNLTPEGLFRPGLSPVSDLIVRHERADERVVVDATLAAEADCGALTKCLARLVDPATRRVLAQAAFTFAEPEDGAYAELPVRATLPLPFPLDEVAEGWIEVVPDERWFVRSAKGRRIRRALRWADAALRAERRPAGLAPAAAPEDWARLAAAAWEQSRADWEAAADPRRASLATRRQAQADAAARACLPADPPPGPAYLAETLGR